MTLTLTQLRQKVTDNLADFSNIVPEKVREVDNEIINFLESIAPIQSGFISGLNVATGITGFGGDIVGAVHTAGPVNESLIVCTLATPVVGNYKVNIDVQANAGTMLASNDILTPVFEIISSTQFRIGIKESAGGNQNITLHMEIKKINY